MAPTLPALASPLSVIFLIASTAGFSALGVPLPSLRAQIRSEANVRTSGYVNALGISRASRRLRLTRVAPVMALSGDVQKQMRGLSSSNRKRRSSGFDSDKVQESRGPSITPNPEGADGERESESVMLGADGERESESVSASPLVAVIGATGGVGRECVRALKVKPDQFRVRAVVRNRFGDGSLSLMSYLGPNDTIVEADVTKPSTLRPALLGADYIIFAAAAGTGGATTSPSALSSSASPEPPAPNPLDKARAGNLPSLQDLLSPLQSLPLPDEKIIDAVLLGGFERVDNRGVGNVAAVVSGFDSPPVSRLILISSLGVTRFPLVQLSSLAGDVLAQKRKGEQALADSGVKYTIIRPAGLRDEPARGTLRITQGDTDFGSVARADVARACVAVIENPELAKDSTFEIVGDASKTSPEGWKKALATVKPDSEVKSPVEEALGFNPLNPESVLEKIFQTAGLRK